MKSFRDQDPVKVGSLAIAVIALLLLVGANVHHLPLIGDGPTYYAHFRDTSGLAPGAKVTLAGVNVGEVTSIELDGTRVKVGFAAKTDARIGSRTTATIKLGTLFGDRILALDSAGSGELGEGATIPLSRTQSPYDTMVAFGDLASTVGAIDTDQLADALGTLADVSRHAPQSFRGALTGVSRVSTAVAAKDRDIERLTKRLATVMATLNARDTDLVTIMNEAGPLFAALVERREAIHNLLVSATRVAAELSRMVDLSRADLEPALTSLHTVIEIFDKNQENLDRTLPLLAAQFRLETNTIGNGPWIDAYVANLPPVPSAGR